MIKLFVDPNRLAPEGWEQAWTALQAKAILSERAVSHLSVAHDLGMMARDCSKCWYETSAPWCAPGGESICFIGCTCPCHTTPAPNGYELLRWMVDTDTWPVTKPVVHSVSIMSMAMRELIERHWGYRGPNP